MLVRFLQTGLILCVLGVLGVGSAPATAQSGRPKADVTPLTERAQVRGGTTIRVALKVTLPEGLHMQSDSPRDPLLIATELTIDVSLIESFWSSNSFFSKAIWRRSLVL